VVLRDREALARQLEGFLAAEDAQRAGAEGGAEGAVAPGSAEEAQLVLQLRQMIKDGVTDDCSVCLDDLKSPVITPCAHVFCRACIETVLATVKPPNCPLCRRELTKAQLQEAGHQEGEEVEDTTLADMADIVVNESSSKVNAALKEMMRIKRDKPDDKIVVVSQFTSFLNVVQPLLDKNGFSYVRLDGTMPLEERSEVIKVFQAEGKNTPKVRNIIMAFSWNRQVMLLSLKAGGVGLNLTAANHLLLLDPAWNPASEWQCFDRTHRLVRLCNIFRCLTALSSNSLKEGYSSGNAWSYRPRGAIV
jgi:SWI/SNF-related matrix-associated actin-dependent regulator of chromatin subfamily A3